MPGDLPTTKFAYFCGDEQFQPEVLVRHARLAEEAGFDMVVVSEHFHPWVDDAGSSGFTFSILGAIAQSTERIGLATGVVTPLWRFHPATVAQAAATIDRLSGGRFHLGVGTGENINEGPLGYHFPEYVERADRIREALEIMRRLLDGEKLTFLGRFYETDRAKLYSPPTRRIPIWLGAGGPKSAALAGQLADGVITSVKDPKVAAERVISPARKAATSAHRSRPTVVATRWAIHADDDEEAWRALLPWRGLRAPGRLQAVDPMTLRERADALPREEILDRFTRAATADEIVATYLPLITEVGADVVTVQMTSNDQEALIGRLGAEVLPRLRELASSKSD